MIAEERETTITYTDASDKIIITTCIRKDITALKKKDQFVLLNEGKYSDGTAYAEFEIDRDRFDIARAAKTQRVMTDAQRQAAAERLSKARLKKGTSNE